MLSILDILILVLGASSTSASPVRRWLNTSSSEAVIPSSSAPVVLPLNATATIERAAADVAQTSSDDCEDMPTSTTDAPRTWPAALSDIQTIQTSGSVADGAPTESYGQPSTAAAYISSEDSPFAPTNLGQASSYTITSLARNANATVPASSGGRGAAKPYGSSSLDGTTTLTLYTTVGQNYDATASASASASSFSVPANSSSASSSSASASSASASAYGGQTTSMAAYTDQDGYPTSQTTSSTQLRSSDSPRAYGSQPALSSSSAEASSPASSSYSEATTRTKHRPTRPPHHASSESGTPPAQYTTTAENSASSSAAAYPYPSASSSESASTESATGEPGPTSYSPPSQAYSYSPKPTTSLPPAEPPILPTSQDSSQSPPSPTQTYGPNSPDLPTVVTGSPSSAGDMTASSTSSSSSSTTPLAGITIVPVDPDAATVYVTVTTTEAGMTTTVAGATVTAYA